MLAPTNFPLSPYFLPIGKKKRLSKEALVAGLRIELRTSGL